MSFDIAVGRCIEIDDAIAVVRLDGAMLRKLCTDLVFTVPPEARLRVPLSLCSTQRPPREGQELFLDFQKTRAGAPTSLDVHGKSVDVDIRLLATDVMPMPRPEPARKRQFY